MIIKKQISYMDRNELVIVFYNSFKYYFLIVISITILLLYSTLTSSFPDSEFKWLTTAVVLFQGTAAPLGAL